MLEWNSQKVYDAYEKETYRRVREACVMCVRECKKLLSKTSNMRRRSKKTGIMWSPVHSSSPNPPWKITGVLQSSIDFQIVRESGKVRGFFGVRKGAADEYALILEMGYGRMRGERPFVRQAYHQNRAEIKRILAVK